MDNATGITAATRAADINLLRQVIAHARANSWHHDITQLDDLPVEHRWMRDGVKVSFWAGTLYVNASQVRPATVRQAVNLLVDLDVLPLTLHSAYAAGEAAAAPMVVAEPIDWPEELLNARVTFDPHRGPLPLCDRPLPCELHPRSAASEPVCGAEHGNRGPCQMPAGHNMGRADIPENHYFPAASEPRFSPEGPHDDVAKCPQCGRQSRSYSRGCSECGYGKPTPATEEPTRTLTAVERDAEQYIAPLGVGEPWHDPNAELLRVEGGE